jgi:peptidyl-prolyl cis-trans isomerase A (cyclophilin A)
MPSRKSTLAHSLFGLGSLALVACTPSPRPAPPPADAEQSEALPPTSPQASQPVDLVVPTPPAATAELRATAEPLRSTAGPLLPRLRSARRVTATITTDLGALRCQLFTDKAPNTVESFVGLATGEKPWRDPRSERMTNAPAYDGTSFHRIIPGFMIQGGDRKGDGTGDPGFVIDDEIWPGSKHDRAGLLCMANRGKNTNGSQFFITDAAAEHLDGGYTIFGECGPVGVVHEIANVPTGPGGRPDRPVVIQRVTIELE